jgi:outer membrane scaffolding protein for murein synthesis (MipA/OmpV family)
MIAPVLAIDDVRPLLSCRDKMKHRMKMAVIAALSAMSAEAWAQSFPVEVVESVPHIIGLGVGATVLTDVGGKSDGTRVRLNARYWRQVAPQWDFHVGGGVYYGDSNYNSYYFSVTPQNVGTSRLPLFNAGSGVSEYYLTLGGLYYVSKQWIVAAGVRASQLTGDAKDSPVVSLRGDKPQFIGGVGVAYLWH